MRDNRIFEFAEKNNVKALRALIKVRRADKDARFSSSSTSSTYSLFSELIKYASATDRNVKYGVLVVYAIFIGVLLWKKCYHNYCFDCSYESASGFTAIGLTMIVGFIGIGCLVKNLPSKKADNGINKNGWTALHFAASGNASNAFNFLLKIGVDHHIQDSFGRTCIDIAYAKGHKTIILKMTDYLQKKVIKTRAKLNDKVQENNILLKRIEQLTEELNQLYSLLGIQPKDSTSSGDDENYECGSCGYSSN